MTNDEVIISLSITPTWSILKEVRQKTEDLMKKKNADTDTIDSTIMCATELVENAIKYGSSNSGQNNINFDLIVQNTIRIKVANGIKDEKDAQNVKYHIEKIQNTDDPAKLYTDRLMQLMDNAKPGESQLGLYRIAYEGEFKLDYTYKNNVLTIMAEKKFNLDS